jgi:Na+-translocating ferredoxin:NAD+ oxidoreductase RNF subunit RnfB
VQIIYAVAALGGVGILFGALLAVAARFFAVESDPRVEAVREALPGANCGACGFAGCTKFAEAVVEGKAASNGCIPGGSGSAEAIAAVLGREAELSVPLVATVFCIGDCESSRDLFLYHGIKDCVHAQKYGGGFKACTDGCLGLGNCVRACPFEAIRMGPNALPLVDREKCGGCGLCAVSCPRNIIKILPKGDRGHLVLCSSHQRGKTVQNVCDVGCTACNACVKACPQEAITIEDNLAVIDLAKCNDCGDCVLKCRQGTIFPRARIGGVSGRTRAAAGARA